MKNTILYPYDNLVTSVLMNDYYQYAYENTHHSAPVKTNNKLSCDNLVTSVLMNDFYQYSYETAVANGKHEKHP